MKSLFSFLYLFLLLISHARGVVGPEDSIAPNGPESVCRILVRGDQGLSICSGTLVSSNKILSAAHCIRRDHAITTVECGYQGFDPLKLQSELSISGNTVFTKGVYFKETAKAITYVVNEEADQSLMMLDHELALSPMKVVTQANQNDETCFFSGYGLGKNVTAGLLNTGKIQAYSTNEEKLVTTTFLISSFFQEKGALEKNEDIRALIRGNQTEKMFSSIGLLGDSGGPIICKDSNGELLLTGVFANVEGTVVSNEKSKREAFTTWKFSTTSNAPDSNLINGLPSVPRNKPPELPSEIAPKLQ